MKMNSIATALALNLSIRTTAGFCQYGRQHRSMTRGVIHQIVSNQKTQTEAVVNAVNVKEEEKDLDWETFEFSNNPKKDKRFSIGREQKKNDKLDATAEATEDGIAAARMDEMNAAFRELPPALVEEATEVISQYINPLRMERVNGVLSQRTRRSRFLFENPANPSNVFACLRTIDSFGFQYVDIIVDSSKYDKPMALIQKRGIRSAMGSAHWITLTNYSSTEDSVKQLKSQGYKIFASDLNPSSKDVRELDWDGPICVVMGNEDRGISQEMRDLADETFTLPMCGFAESFNLSVATAITCAHMSASSTEKGKGPIQPGDLDEHEVNCLRLKWYMNSLPQHKMGGALLRKAGIKLPKVFDTL